MYNAQQYKKLDSAKMGHIFQTGFTWGMTALGLLGQSVASGSPVDAQVSKIEQGVAALYEDLQKGTGGSKETFFAKYDQLAEKFGSAYQSLEDAFGGVTDEIQWTLGGKNYRPALDASLGKLIENLQSQVKEFGSKLEEFDSLESQDSLLSQALLPNFPDLVRLQITHGRPFSVLTLLTLCAADLRLNVAALDLEHALQLVKGLPKLAYQDFRLLYARKEEALNRFHAFFAGFPKVPFGEIANPKNGTWDDMAPFLSVMPVRQDMLAKLALYTLEYGHHRFERYLEHYPRPRRAESLGKQAEALVNTPGSHRCILLTLGFLDDFEGPSCRPKEFVRVLESYLDVYRENVGDSPIPMLMRTFTEFKKEGNLGRPEGWIVLERELDEKVELLNFPKWARRAWPQAKAMILSNKEALTTLLGKGPELYRYLRTAVAKTDMAPMLGLGFGVDLTEDLLVAEFLLEEFKRKGLDRLPKEITQVEEKMDPDIFLKRDFSTSPLVVNILRRATDLLSRDDQSMDRLLRPVPLYEVELIGVGGLAKKLDPDVRDRMVEDDLVRRQTVEPSDSLIAGIFAMTAEALIFPNVVQASLLLGEEVGETLEDFGIAESKTGALEFARGVVKAPSYIQEISQIRNGFFEILRGWAGERGLLSVPPVSMPGVMSSIVPGIEPTTTNHALADWQFELWGVIEAHQVTESRLRTDVYPAYHAEKALKMAYAAEAIRLLDRMAQNAPSGIAGKAQVATPPLRQILNQQDLFSNEVGGGYGAGINLSLVREFMPAVRELYIHFKSLGVKKGSKEELALREVRKREFLTGPEILELFKMTEEGSSAPYVWEALKQAGIGADTILQFRRQNAVFFEKMSHHARQIAGVDFARINLTMVTLLSMFPALIVGDLWKTYRGGVSEYISALKAYRMNAITILGRIRSYDDNRSLLRLLIRNPATLSMVLSRHPKFAKRIFELKKELFRYDPETLLDKSSALLNWASLGTLTAAAMVPDPTTVTQDTLLTVSAAMALTTMALDGMSAKLKLWRAEEVLALNAGFGGQCDIERANENAYELARLRERHYQARLQVGLQALALGSLALAKFPSTVKILRYPGRSFVDYMKYAGYSLSRGKGVDIGARMATEERSVLLKLLPRRLATLLTRAMRLRDGLTYVPRHLGFLSRPEKGLYELIFERLPLMRKSWNIAWEVADWALLSYPLRFVGLTWGKNAAIRWSGRVFSALAVLETVHYLRRGTRDEATLVAKRVFLNKDHGYDEKEHRTVEDHYKALLDWMERMDVDPGEFVEIVKHDDRFDQRFAWERDRRNKEIMDYLNSQNQASAERELEQQKELAARVDKLIAETGGKKAEVMMLRWNRNELKEKIESYERSLRELKSPKAREAG